MSRRRNLYISVNGGIPAATTLHPRWNDSGDPTIFGTDRFGFGALPGGGKSDTSHDLGILFNLWTSTELYDVGAIVMYIANDGSALNSIDDNKYTGSSIRAVRPSTTAEQLHPDGLISATYTDIDGNIYQCTKIGFQVWTTSNLKVTKYIDGTVIPWNLTDASWAGDTVGATAVFNKTFDFGYIPVDELTTEELMVAAYGRLYNWYAVDNVKGLIDPTDGWHVPTDAEFIQMIDYLCTIPGITIDNVGDVLKSTRQVNSPYIIYT